MLSDAMLLKKPDFISFFKFAGLSSLSMFKTYKLVNPRDKRPINEKNVVVATGCDSGLGFSMAIHCHEKLKMSIIACVLNKQSSGAQKLKEMFVSSERFHLIELDVTKDESIDAVRKFVHEILEDKNELGKQKNSLTLTVKNKTFNFC